MESRGQRRVAFFNREPVGWMRVPTCMTAECSRPVGNVGLSVVGVKGDGYGPSTDNVTQGSQGCVAFMLPAMEGRQVVNS